MKQKLLALLLALAMVLSFATVFAAEEADPSPPAEAEPLTEEPVTETEPEKVDLKKQIVPESEVPDLIDYDIAVAEKYVCRAYWEETALNEVVFLKADGSLARYVFSFPVKYEVDGEVYDKQPELVARETLLANTYRYELTAQNDTSLYCAENLSKGFFFQGEDMQVNLRPITEAEYDFLRGHIEAGEIVGPMGGFSFETYDSVAVTGTAQSALATESKSTAAALYALSTTGQQASLAAAQDTLAVVPSYTGFQLQLDLAEGAASTTLYFELDPNGLILARPADTLLLYDKYGNTVGIVGDLLSDRGMAHDVAYSVTALDNGNYLLAATLPRTSGGNYTMSITLDYDDLVDATIYSSANMRDKNYPESANLWVGYEPYSGYERVLIRPMSWSFTNTSQPNQVITSAQITIRDVTVTTPEEVIECRQFTGIAWEEETADWLGVNGDSMGPVCDDNAVSSAIGWTEGYYYSFDITGLVQNWYQGTASWQKGVIFTWKNATATEMEKCFASTEYPTEAYRPKLVYEYAGVTTLSDGVYRIKNASEGNYMTSDDAITNGTAVTMETLYTDDFYNQFWRVHALGGGYYSIRPMHYTLAALDITGEEIDIWDVGVFDEMEEIPSYATWRVENGTSGYVISSFTDNRAIASSGGDVFTLDSSEVWTDYSTEWVFEQATNPPRSVRFFDSSTNQQVYSPTADLCVGESEFIAGLGYKIAMCMPGSIDPADYTWYTANTSIAEVVLPLNVVARNTGTVSLCVQWYDEYNDPCVSVIQLNCYPLEDGDYFIRNVKTGKYADIKDQAMANGTLIHQWQFHGHWTQEWTFERYSGFYYTIKSTVSGTPYYMSTDGSTVKLKSNANGITDDMLWYLSYSDYGNMKIAPKARHSQNYVMAVAWDGTNQEQNGLSFIEQIYSDDAYDTDEWELYNPSSYENVLNISVYADEGYTQRYSSPDDYYLDRINRCMQRAQEFYMIEFGIWIHYSGIEVFESLADMCDSPYYEYCECANGDCVNSNFSADTSEYSTSHCKNMFNIAAHAGLPDLESGESVKIIFTGHMTCTQGNHNGTSYAGIAWKNYGVAIVCNFAENQQYEIKTFVHEIGHLYGTLDHRSEEKNQQYEAKYPGYDFDENCSYGALGANSIEIAESLLLCDGCRHIIESNASLYQY